MLPSSSSSLSLSFAERSQKAFHDALDAIVPTMPLLMHGSGDVAPALVNRSSARLLAELTVQYVASLVDAAIDAQDMLLEDCHDKDRRANVPIPPPFHDIRQRRKPPPPSPLLLVPVNGETTTATTTTAKSNRKRRSVDEFWDDPLPPPKIRRLGEENEDDDDETEKVGADDNDYDEESPLVPFEEWVGVAGVDFREEKIRMAHVQFPFAIGTQCFIFPICHDAGLYGRVLEVQAAHRNLAPLLIDSVVMDMVQTEAAAATSSSKRAGRNAANSKQKKNSGEQGDKSKNNEDDEDNEEPEEEEEEAEEEEEEDEFSRPSWPGLDSILPIYR